MAHFTTVRKFKVILSLVMSYLVWCASTIQHMPAHALEATWVGQIIGSRCEKDLPILKR